MEVKYSKSEPWSFGNEKSLQQNFPKKSLTEIREFLNKNEIYTRFKQHRRSKKYSPIYVYKKRELFQADVIFFTNSDIVKANRGYKYLFTTIDVYREISLGGHKKG